MSSASNYIECPAELPARATTTTHSLFLGPSVFPLAYMPLLITGGGISGCPDWQQDIRKLIHDTRNCDTLVLVNPRRAVFDVNDKSMTPIQVGWEHRHLDSVDAILFWFPEETLCPITLYELGTWSIKAQASGTKIFIGCHPNYAREVTLLSPSPCAHCRVCSSNRRTYACRRDSRD